MDGPARSHTFSYVWVSGQLVAGAPVRDNLSLNRVRARENNEATRNNYNRATPHSPLGGLALPESIETTREVQWAPASTAGNVNDSPTH